ncbi:Plasmodium vivax Vir protein, putative [Plasmodium vivax]|uniref:Vir protein, putative n=1 Tax=Plasmodium vivax TaxID=5855 RepID=A0A1G4EC52_PLAVI|nr:Plasmodium vivax Vir protein, putative [Plasmodium vivax]SCA59923.1 Plasmodium vivax Vir protein, putative [Plasmodium vivax]
MDFTLNIEKHLTKKDIEEYTSNFHYDYFNKEQDFCKNVPYFTDIKDELKKHYVPDHISEKIKRALCFIYNKKKNQQDKFDTELCSYLYYWIGSKIYPVVKYKILFSKIITMLYEELYSTDFLNTCTALYSDIDKDTFNTYKMLHDYSKDYINIEIDTSHGHTTCDNDYKQFIEKYISIYKETYKDCIREKTKNYDCTKFFSLFGNKSYDDLTSYTCTKVKPQSFILDEKSENVDRRYSSSGVNLSGVIYSPKSHPDTIRSPRAEASTASYPNSGSETQHEINRAISPPMEDIAEVSSSKTIAGSVAPVLGVSSISLLLYKVTPLGGFIRNFLGRNRNMYNPVEYMDSFNPYSDGMDPGGRTMNISYHRL